MQLTQTPVRHHRPEDAPSVFGEQITADYTTRWAGIFPLLAKSALEAATAMQDFTGSKDQATSTATAVPKLKRVAQETGWTQSNSMPGRSETNKVAERAGRSVVEGTRAALGHAGLPPH